MIRSSTLSYSKSFWKRKTITRTGEHTEETTRTGTSSLVKERRTQNQSRKRANTLRKKGALKNQGERSPRECTSKRRRDEGERGVPRV